MPSTLWLIILIFPIFLIFSMLYGRFATRLLLAIATRKSMDKIGVSWLDILKKTSASIGLAFVSLWVLTTLALLAIIHVMVPLKSDIALQTAMVALVIGVAVILLMYFVIGIAYKMEYRFWNTKKTVGLVFKDQKSNLYAFEYVNGKTSMIVMDRQGNIFTTEQFNIQFVKKLRVANSMIEDMVFSYALANIPKESIQHVSKICVSQQDHLIMQLLKEKGKKAFATYTSLLLAFFVEIGFFTCYQEVSMLFAVLLTSLLVLLNYVSQSVLKYRVDCGLYGTCAAEAKEIISFILEWRKKNSDSDGGLPKLVFKEEELAERVLRTDGGEEYAG